MMRSLLFLPGNSPSMLINGDLLGSDSIIIDLEDAVSPDDKDAARILVRNALGFFRYRTTVVVRINGLDTGYWRKDLEEIVPLAPQFILLPKAGCAQDMLTLDQALLALEQANSLTPGGIRVIALVETAVGVEHAYEIASACPRVAALALGAEDLTADLQCKRTKEGAEIAYSRGRLVAAARAAGVECFDTPFTDTDDLEGLEQDARLAKGLGFSGKLVINPRHVGIVNQAFSPSAADIAYAREVMRVIEEGRAQGKGAVALHGKMIDKPIVARARQVLDAAEQMGVKA
ncbi:HpcH/HpaI aldolase/citrate lyase family protein [Lawsonibacter celer]|jgi:citrate lyase subunit beta/citryl-CoA lyase|uniref:HpcH/HpaI aldolase/citrate lyase family protein n=1 Tax=Lawsonibacter celer TaxID=2986526 RepID=UPI00164565D4|nr:CoA ester lyase [Lawsonibacter celer]